MSDRIPKFKNEEEERRSQIYVYKIRIMPLW
jgi:hypothetical protein